MFFLTSLNTDCLLLFKQKKKMSEPPLSFSMWVNEKPKSSTGLDMGVQRRTRGKWVDDASVTQCARCKSAFGVWNRRHHCRKCGDAYCNDCTSRRAVIPLDITIPEPTYGTNADRDPSLPLRVCDNCFVVLYQLKKCDDIPTNWSTFTKFMEQVLDVPTLKVLRRVCREWKKIANHHLTRFFGLQYHIPGQPYMQWERDVLWANRYHFPGHSRWMVQLVRSVEYQTTRGLAQVEEVCMLINAHLDRQVPTTTQEHWGMLCTRNCRDKFSLAELITMLDESVPNEQIRALLVKRALNSAVAATSEELLLYIGCLVHHMSTADCAINESVLGSWLVEQSKRSVVLANEVYWEMSNRTEIETGTDKALTQRELRTINMYKYWLERWAEAVEVGALTLVLSGRSFADGCAGNVQQVRVTREHRSTASSSKQKRHPSGLPVPVAVQTFFRRSEHIVCPTHIAQGEAQIDVTGIRVKESITRPTVIPLMFKDTEGAKASLVRKPVLWKGEDLRKDYIVMNFIRLADLILKRELQKDFFIVTYNVRPTHLEGGFIEMVSDCTTLYDVENGNASGYRGHLFNFVSGDTNINDLRERFMRSTAAYCVLTYLLGAGDRHLDNIMITRDGVLFHIDYGYVMGADPKKMAGLTRVPDMRIDQNIVEALGPPEEFERFKDIVDEIYNCLRRHVEVLTSILRLLVLTTPQIHVRRRFNEEKLMHEVLSRFAPGENHEQARVQIINRIDNSTRSTTHYALVDAAHHMAQTNTVLKAIASTWRSVKQTFF